MPLDGCALLGHEPSDVTTTVVHVLACLPRWFCLEAWIHALIVRV